MIAYLLETHIQLIKYTCIIHTWVGYFSELVLEGEEEEDQ